MVTGVELALVAGALQQVAHTGALVDADEHGLKVVALCGGDTGNNGSCHYQGYRLAQSHTQQEEEAGMF